jgi:serine/threonine protein phosphatase 1
MLKRWLTRGPSVPVPTDAAVPPGTRVYAVGDVHGRLDLLQDLLNRIRRDDAARRPAETRLVLLGDLIDRGPDSAGVVALLAAGVPGFAATDVLMGNHEEMLLGLLAEPEPERLLHYLRVGGYQTLESYGVPERLLELPELYPPRALLEAVPPADRAWLASLGAAVRVGDYLFVHAGIRPGVPLAEQQPTDLRWIRKPFLDSAVDHGVVVVHGHSVVDEVAWRPNRIGIDTGAFASGRLTALGLEGRERWLLATDGPVPMRDGME